MLLLVILFTIKLLGQVNIFKHNFTILEEVSQFPQFHTNSTPVPDYESIFLNLLQKLIFCHVYNHEIP